MNDWDKRELYNLIQKSSTAKAYYLVDGMKQTLMIDHNAFKSICDWIEKKLKEAEKEGYKKGYEKGQIKQSKIDFLLKV
jgi:hypothetical protein